MSIAEKYLEENKAVTMLHPYGIVHLSEAQKAVGLARLEAQLETVVHIDGELTKNFPYAPPNPLKKSIELARQQLSDLKTELGIKD